MWTNYLTVSEAAVHRLGLTCNNTNQPFSYWISHRVHLQIPLKSTKAMKYRTKLHTILLEWIIQEKLVGQNITEEGLRKSFKILSTLSVLFNETKSHKYYVATVTNKSISVDNWQNNTGRTKPKYWQTSLSKCHFIHHKLHAECCWSEHMS
jgi:benzoyl-CoA reductase/2-hydroxyglutaryl-CoA dehydratase subunit BcrC/BadD/HgdB